MLLPATELVEVYFGYAMRAAFCAPERASWALTGTDWMIGNVNAIFVYKIIVHVGVYCILCCILIDIHKMNLFTCTFGSMHAWRKEMKESLTIICSQDMSLV